MNNISGLVLSELVFFSLEDDLLKKVIFDQVSQQLGKFRFDLLVTKCLRADLLSRLLITNPGHFFPDRVHEEGDSLNECLHYAAAASVIFRGVKMIYCFSDNPVNSSVNRSVGNLSLKFF
jgi:hypothetical protein